MTDGIELRSGGSLVERALQLLASGPRHTTELAEAVLGLRGNDRAAAAAVFSLLGTDSRLVVDGAGTWSLAASQEPAPPRPFGEEEWVVVDVETTGGSAQQGHRITEIAAVRVSGGEIRDTFATLVNPERRIPSMITGLTGITDDMVRGAPRFAEVAHQVSDVLRGRVFVAHNAAFDWRFVSMEMERALGRQMDGRQLCTVRLARKLLPALSSRSLDALALYFGLEIEARHRALDDAVATAEVLIRFFSLLEEQGVGDWAGVQQLLSKRAPRRKRSKLPKSMDSA